MEKLSLVGGVHFRATPDERVSIHRERLRVCHVFLCYSCEQSTYMKNLKLAGEGRGEEGRVWLGEGSLALR